MFTIEMKLWMFETLPFWLHHKVVQIKQVTTTQMKKWMVGYIKNQTKCLSSNETMMFELAWNQYHKRYRFTLKNLENKRYVKMLKNQFPRDATKKRKSNISCTISKSLRYISLKNKYKHLFEDGLLPNSK
jgi:hypothetical protein